MTYGIPETAPAMRRVTVSLKEEDWKKFVELNPEPVQWIINQIKASIAQEKETR